MKLTPKTATALYLASLASSLLMMVFIGDAVEAFNHRR